MRSRSSPPCAFALPAAAQPITAAEQARIDALVTKTLADTGVPSASIALVRDGRIVLAKAYGIASPTLGAARPDLPYQIASNSKQFTAMALLLLEDEGKLSLDDKVSKWVPGVTGGDTHRAAPIAQPHRRAAGLLAAGLFVRGDEAAPTAPQGIVDRWAKKPLDYAPGTRWQYSNTGYVVAGLVAEKAAGQPLMAYLQRRIFTPLGMRPVNLDDSNAPGLPRGLYALRARPGAPRHARRRAAGSTPRATMR